MLLLRILPYIFSFHFGSLYSKYNILIRNKDPLSLIESHPSKFATADICRNSHPIAILHWEIEYMIVRGTIQNTALQKYLLLLRLSRPASSFRIQLSDTVLTHIIKPASGLDCFLLRVGIVLLYCVSFTMYYKDLYLQTTPFMQAQYYYDYIYYGIYRTDLELGISRWPNAFVESEEAQPHRILHEHL